MAETIIKKMSDARVFEVEKNRSGNFVFTEKCDDYFFLELTPGQLMQLTVELRLMLND